MFIHSNTAWCHQQKEKCWRWTITSAMLIGEAAFNHEFQQQTITCEHRSRSGWNSEGDAWRAPKVGGCRMGWGMGRVSPLQPTRESGGASWAPQRGSGQSPGGKRILAYFEGHRTLLFVPMWQKSEGGGQFALASPTPNSGRGTCPPRPPWSTPMPVKWAYRPAVRSAYYCLSNLENAPSQRAIKINVNWLALTTAMIPWWAGLTQ